MRCRFIAGAGDMIAIGINSNTLAQLNETQHTLHLPILPLPVCRSLPPTRPGIVHSSSVGQHAASAGTKRRRYSSGSCGCSSPGEDHPLAALPVEQLGQWTTSTYSSLPHTLEHRAIVASLAAHMGNSMIVAVVVSSRCRPEPDIDR